MQSVLRKSVSPLRSASTKTASTAVCIQTRSYATEFFKLPKAKKKGEKGEKKEDVDKQKQLEKYFENVSEEERARILEFEDTRSRQEEEALKHKKEERGRLEAIEYQNFLYWAKKMRADLEQRVAHANDPCFSEEARKKAYELNKKNPNYWTASRLSNLFKMRVDRMQLYLWSSKIEEQAEADGVILDDTIDRLLAKKFGETAFPQDIPDIPDEIPIRKDQSPATWFWIDGDVRSGELLKFIRRRDAKRYRESPKTPKKTIPEVKYITEKMYMPGYQPKTYANKFPVKMVMWDISSTSDMYNRAMVVRQTDGQWRTGNWEERRWAEDYRRYIKRPFLVPYPKIDESQPNNVPAESQLPDDYQKHIADFKY